MGLTAWGAEAVERPDVPLRVQPSALAAPEASATAADTLRYTVKAGTPLIVALPAEHEGREVTYRLLDAPALSWLVDRSFLWRTTEQERGTLPIQIERLPGGETLVLLVELQP